MDEERKEDDDETVQEIEMQNTKKEQPDLLVANVALISNIFMIFIILLLMLYHCVSLYHCVYFIPFCVTVALTFFLIIILLCHLGQGE